MHQNESFIWNMQSREKSLQEMCTMGKHEALHNQNCITMFVVTSCRPGKDVAERVSQIGGKRRARSKTLFRSAHTLSSLLLPEGSSISHDFSCWKSALLPFLPPGLVTTLTFMSSGAEPRWQKAVVQLGPCSFCWPDLHLSPHHIHYNSQVPSASGTAGSTWIHSAGREWTGQWGISSHNSQHTAPNKCTYFSCIALPPISSCTKGENKLTREIYLCLLLSLPTIEFHSKSVWKPCWHQSPGVMTASGSFHYLRAQLSAFLSTGKAP